MVASPKTEGRTLAMLRFDDPERNRKFADLGYTVFPLLSPQDITELQAYWGGLSDPALNRPYALSLGSQDRVLRRQASSFVAERIGRRLTAFLPEVEVVYAGYAEKRADEVASAIPFHQDPSFVDEARWGAGNIWIPLVDITPENGPLFVVAGSHLCPRARRGFNQAFAFEQDQERLRALARPVYARAGEAILFPHSLFHFSPPNQSTQPRLAAGGLVVERGATLEYNFVDPADRSEIGLFAADADTFTEVPIASRPVGEPDARFAATVPALSEGEFARLARLAEDLEAPVQA